MNPRLKILVVEDDPSVVRMLRFPLTDAGFEVTAVGTGADALTALDRQPVDAVLLDLGLPDSRGSCVLDRLRRLEEAGGKHRPAWLVITAQDRDEVAKRYGQLGRRLVPKPFDPWELVDMLRQLITER